MILNLTTSGQNSEINVEYELPDTNKEPKTAIGMQSKREKFSSRFI